jgi:hypothetical protein
MLFDDIIDGLPDPFDIEVSDLISWLAAALGFYPAAVMSLFALAGHHKHWGSGMMIAAPLALLIGLFGVVINSGFHTIPTTRDGLGIIPSGM